MIDFIDYPRVSKFCDLVNKKVIRKKKDEFRGSVNSEFVGLKAEMYSLVNVDREENKKQK